MGLFVHRHKIKFATIATIYFLCHKPVLFKMTDKMVQRSPVGLLVHGIGALKIWQGRSRVFPGDTCMVRQTHWSTACCSQSQIRHFISSNETKISLTWQPACDCLSPCCPSRITQTAHTHTQVCVCVVCCCWLCVLCLLDELKGLERHFSTTPGWDVQSVTDSTLFFLFFY